MTIREELKKYWFYAGEWHDAECSFILHDAGVCNCHCGENRKELEELFQFRLRDSLERVRLAGEDFYGWGDKQERYDWGYSDGLKAAVSEQNKKIATEIKGLGGKE